MLTEQFAAEKNLQLTVVEYLKTPPTLVQLAALHKQLSTEVRQMVRDNEKEFANLQLEKACDTALLEAVATHPKLLQRPIVVYQDRAIIGRPPELLKDFLCGS